MSVRLGVEASPTVIMEWLLSYYQMWSELTRLYSDKEHISAKEVITSLYVQLNPIWLYPEDWPGESLV